MSSSMLQTCLPQVRQAAAYGCGVLGQFGGAGLAAAAAQAVPLMCEVIQQQDSRCVRTRPEEAPSHVLPLILDYFRAVENINPTENAISAVTKILQFNGSQVNLDQILPMW